VTSLFENGEEYLGRAVAGDRDALRKLFAERTAVWAAPIISEETGTYGLFDDLNEQLESYIAFSLVPVAVNIALSQSDKSRLEQAVWLLLGIVEATQTTEVPQAMSEAFPMLREGVTRIGANCVGELSAINRHYRNAL
jgi:hypothetical protein